MLGAGDHNLIRGLVASFVPLVCGKSSRLGEGRFEERFEVFGSEWNRSLEERFCTGPGRGPGGRNR